jgi:hypothetical protein
MWETHTVSGVNLEFGEDNMDYNCIIEFNYLPEEVGNIFGIPDFWTPSYPEEVEVIYIKLEVADNIYTTLDSEYMTGDVLKQAEDIAIEYIEGLKNS